MTPLPTPISPTVSAIYAAYEASRDNYEGRTISIGTLAEECERALFYSFRWASEPEQFEGQRLRLFATGLVEEDRVIADLRAIGCEVVDVDESTGRQITVTACGSHVRGKLDAEIVGLPEAPSKIHVGEFKSHNAKSFAALKKDKLRKSKPLHFGQLMTYMYLRGRDRGIYVAVNKDTDEIYAERVNLDVEYVIRLLARAQRIIDANDPPAKLHEDPNAKMAFACGWCRHRPICHEHAPARTNCRTCLYSSPTEGGSWACGRFNTPLSAEAQAEGCPSHLTLPGLVAGEQIDADEDLETVTYKMHATGEIWIDGGQNAG
ncbi:PD-(D/E)XK nuclease family protein [Devosia neptuniae]|uniref:PD-(D/E)XK nuclease family protein n=1 Tax=Devosia neptuniae TaxID=191302 RepID=A0ABY6CFE8_9HYPH|nr:PD-(D/E)XK nuclease family protein [Devosia neptuniae]UXN70934.1 PD-(D/E)XK nuclease family protein [Devosia neptuniae]